jgi:hypothetical protein
MRRAILVGVGMLVVGMGQQAVAADDPATGSTATPGWSRPERRGFDVEVLVAGRPLEREYRDGLRFVRAVEGADYVLRISNPLPERVAVALSVDGLNAVDARSTGASEASRWLTRPYQTLTVTGWQVGSERAHRFHFTHEADSYAARLGRPADFGVIRAVFYREQQPPIVVAPRPHGTEDSRRESRSAAEARPSTAQAGGADSRRRYEERPGYNQRRAATGIGRSEPGEVDAVDMVLEREPVAEIEVHYAYRPPWRRSEVVPRPWPAPFDGGFCPEP